jgi:hypothetical protein
MIASLTAEAQRTQSLRSADGRRKRSAEMKEFFIPLRDIRPEVFDEGAREKGQTNFLI